MSNPPPAGRPPNSDATRLDVFAADEPEPPAPVAGGVDDTTRRDVFEPEPPRSGEGPAGSGGSGGGHAAGWRRELPAELAGRYEVDRALASIGGQADILICRDRASGTEVAIKLYRETVTESYRAVVARLQRLSHPAILPWIETGASDGTDYEITAYHPAGSLAEHLRRSGPLDSDVALGIARHLAAGITTYHEADVLHRDLTPSNVLVVTDPGHEHPEVAIADPGVAVITTDPQRDRGRVGNIKYQAPETYTGRYDLPIDWWGLGMIILECLIGRSPFVGPDGVELPLDEILSWMRWRPIPLPQANSRATLLLRGLLTKNPAERWGAAELREFFAGGSPREMFDETSTAPPPPTAAARSFPFGGREYTDRRELAEALLADPREGRRLALSDGLEELVGWAEFFDAALAAHLDAIRANVAGNVWRSPLRVLLEIAAALDRTIEPRIDGVVVDRDGLARWGSDASAGDAAAQAILDELAASRALVALALFARGDGLAALDGIWRTVLDEVDAVSGYVPADVADVIASERPRIRALALLVALDPDFGVALVERARRETAGHPAAATQWFAAILQSLRAPEPHVAAAAALVIEAARDEAGEIEHRERMRLIEEAIEVVRQAPPEARQRRYRPFRRSTEAQRGRVADALETSLRLGSVAGYAGVAAGIARFPLDAALSRLGLPSPELLPTRWAAEVAVSAPEPIGVLATAWTEIHLAWMRAPWGVLDPLVAPPVVVVATGVLLVTACALGLLALRRYRYYRADRARPWFRRTVAAAGLAGLAILITLPWQLLLLPVHVLVALRRR